MRATILAVLTLTLPVFAQQVTWLTDLTAAQAAAKKAGKPVIAVFIDADTEYGKRLEKEVLGTPEFVKWAADVIPLRLDCSPKAGTSDERNAIKALYDKYELTGLPAVVFLDAEGKKFGLSGLREMTIADWIGDADQLLREGGFKERTQWLTDYKAALKAARKGNQVVLVDFTGSDWCGWCMKLDKEVFETDEFRTWAKKKKVVLLKLDFPRHKELPAELKKQNDELAKEFGIGGYPSIVFLNAKGKKVGEMSYKEGGTAVWTKLAEEQIANARKK
ncbi:MAG: thioredoxin family protein [Planctomycetes bacterium]|nr:thioredoxin family protein [Planctomycetota bacterium]